MNTFNDFFIKYFDMTFLMPVFSENKLLELVNGIINDVLENQGFSVERRSILDRQIKKENATILNQLKKQLNTIRKVKLFEKLLKGYTSRFKADIYFPDILIFSLLEATDYELFNYIRSNYENFSAYPLAQYGTSLWGYFDVKLLKEKFSDLVNPVKDKRHLLDFLFPQIKFILEFELKEPTDHLSMSDFIYGYNEIYRSIESDNRLTLNVLLFRLFASSSVDKSIEIVTSQDYKDEIINSFKQDNFDLEKSIELLNEIFPKGTEYHNLRQISLGWIYDQIKSQDLGLSYNLVVALSFLAKNLSDHLSGFLGLAEKKQAAYQVWYYLERKGSNQDILIEILKFDNNSDEFADNILFYSIHPDRTPRFVKVLDEIQKQVVPKYLQRLFTKLMKSGSISDKNIFDSPISTIWRWHNALDYLNKNDIRLNLEFNLEGQLFSDLKNDVEFFKSFFGEYVVQDFENEPAVFRPEGLYPMLTKDKLLELITFYISTNKFNNLPIIYYQSMYNWFKNIQSPSTDSI